MTSTPAETPIDATLTQSKGYYEATRTFMADYSRIENQPSPVTVVPWDELTEAHQLRFANLLHPVSRALVTLVLDTAETTETEAIAYLATVKEAGR